MNMIQYIRDLLQPIRLAPVWQRTSRGITHPPQALAWIICTVLVANALAYAVNFSAATIISDGWYFLDVFIRKALDGSLGLSDFFVRRAGFDHAQPLKKLLLLVELRHFDLDFRIGAVVGVLSAFVCLLIIRSIMTWKDATSYGLKNWLWAMACIVLMSLNSVTVWTWGLVTTGFMFYALILFFLIALWRSISTDKYIFLTFSALTIAIVGDDRALITTIASLIALAFTAWRVREYRRTSIKAGGILIGCYILARICYRFLYVAPSSHGMELTTRLAGIWHAFVQGGWYEWALVPLGESIASSVPLTSYPLSIYVGSAAKAIELTIGALLLIAHGWFWYTASRKPMNIQKFSAIVLMLTFYAFVAGIIWARVPVYGNVSLSQARYIVLYSFGNVALLLMCAACDWSQSPRVGCRKVAVVVITLALLWWQLPISRAAWIRGPWIRQYHAHIVDQIWYIAETNKVPKNCMRQVVICKYSPERRADLINLLEKNKLNIFSKNFQRANRLYPPATDK